MQDAAIRGDQRDSRNRSARRNPARVDPLLTFMVRRGSTVRVRQRALQKRRYPGLSRSARLARVLARSVLEPVLEPSRKRVHLGRPMRRPLAANRPWTADLSRRRSRVRVPSLPPQKSLQSGASVCSGCDRLRRTPPVKSVDAAGSAWINGAPLLPNWSGGRLMGSRTAASASTAGLLLRRRPGRRSTRVLWRDHRRLRTSQLKPMLHASRGADWTLARMRARIHTGTLSQNDAPPLREIRSKLDTSVRSLTAYRAPVVVPALGAFAAFLIVTTVATAAPPAAQSARRRRPSGGRRARFGPARFAREAR